MEGAEGEAKKKTETNHLIGCPDAVFFNFSSDEDEDVPLLQIRSLGDSSPSPMVRENRAVIQIESPTQYSSKHNSEKIKLVENWPNPQMLQVRAQNSQSPIASGLKRSLPLAFHQEPLEQLVNYHGSDLRGVCNNGYGDLKSRNAKKEGSRVRKSGERFRRIDRATSVVGTGEPDVKIVRTLNFRTKFSPSRFIPSPFPNSFSNSITNDFVISTNPGPELASIPNSIPVLKLPNQLLQPFYPATLLFPSPILSLIYVNQPITTSPLLCLSSSQLTPNYKNILSFSSVRLSHKAVWQKDPHKDFFDRKSIPHQYFKLFHEYYKDYKVYLELIHHGLPRVEAVSHKLRDQERNHQKLADRIFGPFKIIERIGSVACKLDLPVFHVSLPKETVMPAMTEQNLPLELKLDASDVPTPKEVLTMHSVTQEGKNIVQWLILWQGMTREEATWEVADTIQGQFSDTSLEDKTLIEGESNDTNSDTLLQPSHKPKLLHVILVGPKRDKEGARPI